MQNYQWRSTRSVGVCVGNKKKKKTYLDLFVNLINVRDTSKYGLYFLLGQNRAADLPLLLQRDLEELGDKNVQHTDTRRLMYGSHRAWDAASVKHLEASGNRLQNTRHFSPSSQETQKGQDIALFHAWTDYSLGFGCAAHKLLLPERVGLKTIKSCASSSPVRVNKRFVTWPRIAAHGDISSVSPSGTRKEGEPQKLKNVWLGVIWMRHWYV